MRALIFLLLLPSLAFADAAELLAQQKALKPRRDEPQVERQMEQLHVAMLREAPADYDVLVAGCRWRCWLAYSTSGERKRELGKEAWDLGERALKVRPGQPEASYCAALGIGAYSQAAGILTSIIEGLEEKYLIRLKLAIEKSPAVDDGGPLLAKARYFYEVPWPKKDVAESLRLYRQGLAEYPGNLRLRFYLAQSQLAAGDAVGAKKSLAEVLAGSIAYDPPEGRRVQAEARKFAKGLE